MTYLESLFNTSANLLQWREKDLNLRTVRPFVRRGGELARRHDRIFLVNSMVEAALEEGADGVHLTSKENVAEAVRACQAAGREEFLIGRSVHSVAEALRAEDEGADYVLLAPVFDPLSKSPVLAPLGLKGLGEAVERLRIPVIALGGIDRTNADGVLAAGAAGVAGISWLFEELRGVMTPVRPH